MKSHWFVHGLLVCLSWSFFGLSGCVNPLNTRLPTIDTPPAVVEKESYRIHDPFPDEELGPDTFTRPRGFVEPRSEPRKILESRSLLGIGAAPLPPNSFNYPDTVRQ